MARNHVIEDTYKKIFQMDDVRRKLRKSVKCSSDDSRSERNGSV